MGIENEVTWLLQDCKESGNFIYSIITIICLKEPFI